MRVPPQPQMTEDRGGGVGGEAEEEEGHHKDE
jgi:hypothetical protein